MLVRKTPCASALPRSAAAGERRGIHATQGFILALACALLFASVQLILKSHSVKYPAALIVCAAAASVFMTIRRKLVVAIFSAGFILPFYVQFVLVERGNQVLAVSGAFLVMLILLAVAYGTGALQGKRFFPCASIVGLALLFLIAGVASMLNTTDRMLSLIALEREAEMPIVFLILINVLSEAGYLLCFLRGLFAGFAIECGIYVIQNILGYSFDILGNTRIEGTTDVASGRIGFQRGTFGASPHTAAEYFCVLTLLLVGVYLSRARRAIGIRPVAGILMGGGCLLLAAKRAPLAGFMFGLVTICILLAVHARWALRRLAPLLVALAVPTLVLLPLLASSSASSTGGVPSRYAKT